MDGDLETAFEGRAVGANVEVDGVDRGHENIISYSRILINCGIVFSSTVYV